MTGGEAPNSKRPSSREAPNIKLQQQCGAEFEVWRLRFLWSLNVGAWSFSPSSLVFAHKFPRAASHVCGVAACAGGDFGYEISNLGESQRRDTARLIEFGNRAKGTN
jgi:hypothetical protein